MTSERRYAVPFVTLPLRLRIGLRGAPGRAVGLQQVHVVDAPMRHDLVAEIDAMREEGGVGLVDDELAFGRAGEA